MMVQEQQQHADVRSPDFTGPLPTTTHQPVREYTFVLKEQSLGLRKICSHVISIFVWIIKGATPVLQNHLSGLCTFVYLLVFSEQSSLYPAL